MTPAGLLQGSAAQVASSSMPFTDAIFLLTRPHPVRAMRKTARGGLRPSARCLPLGERTEGAGIEHFLCPPALHALGDRGPEGLVEFEGHRRQLAGG